MSLGSLLLRSGFGRDQPLHWNRQPPPLVIAKGRAVASPSSPVRYWCLREPKGTTHAFDFEGVQQWQRRPASVYLRRRKCLVAAPMGWCACGNAKLRPIVWRFRCAFGCLASLGDTWHSEHDFATSGGQVPQMLIGASTRQLMISSG